LYPGDRAAAVRALLLLGLDAAARPQTYDERWLDVSERLAQIEALLDAVGIAVSAMPALVAWLQQQATPYLSDDAKAALAERVEALIQADWDQRCRNRGIPRPRFTRVPRRTPIGDSVMPPLRRAWQTSVRLPSALRSRVVALALRENTTSQAALRRALLVGLDALEDRAYRDDVQRLLDAAKRIEVQLDEIGALATSGPSVGVHLWRRGKGYSGEAEAAVLAELHAVALATWAHLVAGPSDPGMPRDDDDSAEG
jgi:predicted DNA-binding protein